MTSSLAECLIVGFMIHTISYSVYLGVVASRMYAVVLFIQASLCIPPALDRISRSLAGYQIRNREHNSCSRFGTCRLEIFLS